MVPTPLPDKKGKKKIDWQKFPKTASGNKNTETQLQKAAPRPREFLKPIGYERQLASFPHQKAEADRLLEAAKNYNHKCLISCKRSLEKANVAAELYLKCAQVDEKARLGYYNSLELCMKLVLVFDLRSKRRPEDECKCSEVMDPKELSIDDIYWWKFGDFL